MKNLSLALNVVLIIAVGVLYYLHFTDKPTQKTGAEATVTSADNANGAVIAYVRTDSLLKNYEFYQDIQQTLQEKQKTMEAQLNSKSSAFEKKAADFQYKVDKMLVTQKQAESMQKQLMEEQQNLMRMKDQLSMQLMESEQIMTSQLFDSISSFLKQYNKDKGFTFIMRNTGEMYYADKSLNITDHVIKGLNSRYSASEKDEDDEKSEEKDDE